MFNITKKILIFFLFNFLFLQAFITPVSAQNKPPGVDCTGDAECARGSWCILQQTVNKYPTKRGFSVCDIPQIGDSCSATSKCPTGSQCIPDPASGLLTCSPAVLPLPVPGPLDVFGKIRAPEAVRNLGVGGEGISSFLNNLITLIYIIAAVIFVFMLLWGAIEWLSSGGSKEGLDNAKKRITSALIGIVLFAVAFAIINLIGIFTGFTLFINKSPSACPGDQFYFDNNKNSCIHKVFDAKCQEIYIEVDDRFCGR